MDTSVIMAATAAVANTCVSCQLVTSGVWYTSLLHADAIILLIQVRGLSQCFLSLVAASSCIEGSIVAEVAAFLSHTPTTWSACDV
jgi:hypothetical protein